MPGRGRKTARACVPPPPEEPSCRAVAAAARSRDGHRESAGRTMQSLDNTGADELQEPGRPLTDDKPPGASEEPAAAEAAGTPPGPGWCWLCRSSPCASRVQPGELGVRPGCEIRPWRNQAGARAGISTAVGWGALRTALPIPTVSRGLKNLERSPGGPGNKVEVLYPRRRENRRKFLIV